MEKLLFKVVQITDSHILENKNDLLYGTNTLDHFSRIIQYIAEQDFDIVLFTGDLSHHGNRESYQLINHELSILDKPIYCIPGNHDLLENMQQALSHRTIILNESQFTQFNWQFIFLSTPIPNKSSGLIQEEDLHSLRKKLEDSEADYICLVMHHHPISVNNRFIDKYMLENPIELQEAFNDKVKLVIFGHVHGDYLHESNGVTYHACPSTAFQFAVNDKQEIIYKSGFKEYLFYKNHFLSNCIWR